MHLVPAGDLPIGTVVAAETIHRVSVDAADVTEALRWHLTFCFYRMPFWLVCITEQVKSLSLHDACMEDARKHMRLPFNT